MTATRPTSLLGFRDPVVKTGEIVLPVMTGAGAWFELSATPDLWRRIAQAVLGQDNPEPQAEPASRGVGGAEAERLREAVLRRPLRKPSGRLL